MRTRPAPSPSPLRSGNGGGEPPHGAARPAQIHPLGEDPALLQALTPRSLARSVAELEALRSRVQELEQKLSVHNELEAVATAKKLPPLQLAEGSTAASSASSSPSSTGATADSTPSGSATPLQLVKSLGELPPFALLALPFDRVATAPELSIRRHRAASASSSPSPSRLLGKSAALHSAIDSSSTDSAAVVAVSSLNTTAITVATDRSPPAPASASSPLSPVVITTAAKGSPPREQTKISLDPSGAATVAVSQRNRLYQILKRVSAVVSVGEDDLMLLKKLVDAEVGDVIRFLVDVEDEQDASTVRDKLSLLLRAGSPAKHRAFVSGTAVATANGIETLPRLAPHHPIWGIQYPLRKLARNLEQLRRPKPESGCDDKLDVIVLVASGAYNPVHMLHVRAFYVARQYVESNYKFPVVGAFLSPSHDTFVRAKHRRNPREMIPKRHRLALAEAAVASSSWIEVDKWEITRRRVLDYLSTLTHVREMCEAHFASSGFRFQLMYVCGCNTVVKLSHAALRDDNFGCIVVCRPAQRESVVKHLGKTLSRSTTIVEDTGVLPCDLERATSVRVRKALLELSAGGGSSASSTAGGGGLAALELMVGKPVLHHLVKHGIADKMAGKEQWTDEDKTWRAEDLPYVEYIES